MRLAVQVGFLLAFGVVVVVIVVIIHDVTQENKSSSSGGREQAQDNLRITNVTVNRNLNFTMALPQNFRNTIANKYDDGFNGDVYIPNNTAENAVPVAVYSAIPFLAVAAFIVFLCLKGTTWFKEDLNESYFADDIKAYGVHKEMVNWLSDSKPTSTSPTSEKSKRKVKVKAKPQRGESHLLMQMLLQAEETTFGTSKEVILTRNVLTRDVTVSTRDDECESDGEYPVLYGRSPRINRKHIFDTDKVSPLASQHHSSIGCDSIGECKHIREHHKQHHKNHDDKCLKARHVEIFHAFNPSVVSGAHRGHATQTITVEVECHPIPNARSQSKDIGEKHVFLSHPSLTSDGSSRGANDTHYLSPKQQALSCFSNISENNLCVPRDKNEIKFSSGPHDSPKRRLSLYDVESSDQHPLLSIAHLPADVRPLPEPSDLTSSSESCASHTLSNNDADSGCYTENSTRNELSRRSMEPT